MKKPNVFKQFWKTAFEFPAPTQFDISSVFRYVSTIHFEAPPAFPLRPEKGNA
jgi:hypothetical protein